MVTAIKLRRFAQDDVLLNVMVSSDLQLQELAAGWFRCTVNRLL